MASGAPARAGADVLAAAGLAGHLLAMLAASLWMWGEQLERASAPSWRWRAPLKAVRLVLAQAQQRLRALRPATAAFRS